MTHNYVHIYHHYVLRFVTDGPSPEPQPDSGCGRVAEVLFQAPLRIRTSSTAVAAQAESKLGATGHHHSALHDYPESIHHHRFMRLRRPRRAGYLVQGRRKEAMENMSQKHSSLPPVVGQAQHSQRSVEAQSSQSS